MYNEFLDHGYLLSQISQIFSRKNFCTCMVDWSLRPAKPDFFPNMNFLSSILPIFEANNGLLVFKYIDIAPC